MSQRLHGRVAVVTGGASGIGLGIARRYVAEGAQVMLADVDDENLAEAVEELGASAAGVHADVTREDDVAAMVAATLERFDRLDVSVNAAGTGTLWPIDAHPVEEWDRVLEVNLRGTFLVLKHAAQVMRAAGSGVIVNIASTNATVPAKGMAAYCASKAGVDMLTRVAALELAPSGVRVAGIAPGLTETPLTAPVVDYVPLRNAYLDRIPMGRIGTPDDIAGFAAYLASDDATWVTGHTFPIDGGEGNLSYPDLLNVPEE